MTEASRLNHILLCSVIIVASSCLVNNNNEKANKKPQELELEPELELDQSDELSEQRSIQVIINGSFSYSEKGEIKNVLEAGKLERFEDNDIWEVEDGFTLYISGDKTSNQATLSGGRGVYDSKIGHLIARDDVVLVNNEGDRLKTEYLVWSNDSDKVHTNRPVSVETSTGILFGRGLVADGSFENYKILEPTGSFDLP